MMYWDIWDILVIKYEIVVHDADFPVVLGSELDIRQTGNQVENFVPNGKVAQIDIDEAELNNPRGLMLIGE